MLEFTPNNSTCLCETNIPSPRENGLKNNIKDSIILNLRFYTGITEARTPFGVFFYPNPSFEPTPKSTAFLYAACSLLPCVIIYLLYLFTFEIVNSKKGILSIIIFHYIFIFHKYPIIITYNSYYYLNTYSQIKVNTILLLYSPAVCLNHMIHFSIKHFHKKLSAPIYLFDFTSSLNHSILT